jgi:hypothetical protein
MVSADEAEGQGALVFVTKYPHIVIWLFYGVYLIVVLYQQTFDWLCCHCGFNN